jgi:hypothetical protein
MKDLDNFNPTQLHLVKLSHLSTWTAVLFWLIAALAIVATCCCCYCLCPACCGQCITCLCTSICKCIPLPKVPKRIVNPIRAFSSNIYDTPVHYQSEVSRIHMPRHASAPSEPSQVIQNQSPRENVSILQFASKPTVSYPALPTTDRWIPITEPNRRVFKCDDIYYCIDCVKCFDKNGNAANILPPSYEQIQEIKKNPEPPPINVEYKRTSDKPIICWKFSDTDELIWEGHHWHNTESTRFYYGYGPPAPKSTSAKN